MFRKVEFRLQQGQRRDSRMIRETEPFCQRRPSKPGNVEAEM